MPIHNQVVLDPQNNQPSSAGLQTTGAVLSVEISVHPTLAQHLRERGIPIPPPVVGTGLIDTGATVTAVDAMALAQLGIPPVGQMNVYTPSGTATQQQFPASIAFPGTRLPTISFTFVIGATLAPQGMLALIGRDVLQHFVLIYNGTLGHFVLAV